MADLLRSTRELEKISWLTVDRIWFKGIPITRSTSRRIVRIRIKEGSLGRFYESWSFWNQNSYCLNKVHIFLVFRYYLLHSNSSFWPIMISSFIFNLILLFQRYFLYWYFIYLNLWNRVVFIPFIQNFSDTKLLTSKRLKIFYCSQHFVRDDQILYQ